MSSVIEKYAIMLLRAEEDVQSTYTRHLEALRAKAEIKEKFDFMVREEIKRRQDAHDES